MNLSAIDLNLLVALDALLRERSVTRAARRVGLSQPAMSHALSRLRELLQDPLLFRVGKSMALTERAEALAEPTRAALQGLEALLAAPERFDPGRSARQFRIATTDYAQFLLLRIPTALGHPFRWHSATRSGDSATCSGDSATRSDGTRPPIPVTRPPVPAALGHRFR